MDRKTYVQQATALMGQVSYTRLEEEIINVRQNGAYNEEDKHKRIEEARYKWAHEAMLAAGALAETLDNGPEGYYPFTGKGFWGCL